MPGAEVGDDVAVEVRQHDHVVLLGPRHELVAEVVDDPVLELDLGIVARATRRATSRNRPSENFMMLALCAAVTFARPLSLAYSNAARTIRSEPNTEIGLIEMPECSRSWMPSSSSMKRAQCLGVLGVHLELDAGVEVLGVLADDHEVGLGEAGAHALVGLARPHAGVEVELLAQQHVDRAEAGAHRRGGRALDADLRVA